MKVSVISRYIYIQVYPKEHNINLGRKLILEQRSKQIANFILREINKSLYWLGSYLSVLHQLKH